MMTSHIILQFIVLLNSVVAFMNHSQVARLQGES